MKRKVITFCHAAVLTLILALLFCLPDSPAVAAEAVTPEAAVSAAPDVADDALLVKLFNKMNKARRLSEKDIGLYRDIFAAQDEGDFAAANKLIKSIKDHRLMGHVLRQRYLSPDYKAGYDELAAWVKAYGDHAGAQAVFDLALSRKPAKGGVPLASLRTTRGVTGPDDADVGPMSQSVLDEEKFSPAARDLIKSVRAVSSDKPTLALKRLGAKNAVGLLGGAAYDALRAEIASAYLFNKKYDDAYKLARASLSTSGKNVPLAGWVAGLGAWHKGSYAEAAGYFEETAQSPRASAWLVTASAYWAARSWLRAEQPQKVSPWLVKAAEYPRSFYGIIALKALGIEQSRFDWELPRLNPGHLKDLSRVPAGRRAIALVDVGQEVLAAAELSQINPGSDDDLKEAVLAFAAESGLPSVLLRVGGVFKTRAGELYDAALYPDTPWLDNDTLEVSPALIYAFMRQESRFDPLASNRGSGAMGVMQLMPSTARHVVTRTGGEEETARKLLDPRINVDLGQKYLKHLLDLPGIRGNLFRLALAYNAGPGKLARFQEAWTSEEDPLLFIESFPVSETRMFVERVLTNYWIYSIKHGGDTSSIEAVARGDWPLYSPAK